MLNFAWISPLILQVLILKNYHKLAIIFRRCDVTRVCSGLTIDVAPIVWKRYASAGRWPFRFFPVIRRYLPPRQLIGSIKWLYAAWFRDIDNINLSVSAMFCHYSDHNTATLTSSVGFPVDGVSSRLDESHRRVLWGETWAILSAYYYKNVQH